MEYGYFKHFRCCAHEVFAILGSQTELIGWKLLAFRVRLSVSECFTSKYRTRRLSRNVGN